MAIETLSFKIDASAVIEKFEGLGEALTDIVTHSGDFRYALETMRDTATATSEDKDDPGYWQHQINTLDRIVGVVQKLNTAEAPDPAQPELF